MARYLVTGGAGFIGSHVADALVARGDEVSILDDFSTGHRANIDAISSSVNLFTGSICDEALLREAMDGVDYCCHQAAIPSVPRSVKDPVATNFANVEGTLRLLVAARDSGVKRIVCASSSSVYGNEGAVPSVESAPLDPLSPYAVTKATDEMYAKTFTDLYGMEVVCLRYFNVFGPRQDPDSPYSAVIPLFLRAMLRGKPPRVEGDGNQSRDFSFVENVVQANILACEAPGPIAGVYNIACGLTTSILDLVSLLNDILGTELSPEFVDARPGDVRQSWADIRKASKTFGYTPSVMLRPGLERCVEYHRQF